MSFRIRVMGLLGAACLLLLCAPALLAQVQTGDIVGTVTDASGAVLLEEGIPSETMADLVKRGHKIQPISGWEREVFGRGQIILRDPETGVLTGGSDPRADGCAMPLV